MLSFLARHAGDILVLALVLAGVGLVLRSMVRNKKAGKPVCGGCDGDCAHCRNHH